MTDIRLPAARPRERLLRSGPSLLSERDLWQCILGSGRRGWPVEKIAAEVQRTFSSGKSKKSHFALPLGQAQKARVLAVIELFSRWHTAPQSVSLTSPSDVLAWCTDLRRAKQEQLLVLYCGVSGNVLRNEVVAVGGLQQVSVAPRDIFRLASELPVDSLVLCHNHPSGSILPSSQDEVFTARIEAACKLLGYWLRDHIIVTANEHFSFRSQGKLETLPD